MRSTQSFQHRQSPPPHRLRLRLGHAIDPPLWPSSLALARRLIAKQIDVSAFLRMGEGEMKTGGAHRPSITADAMEAIFGAVFAESGFEAAQKVILGLFEPILAAPTAEQLGKDSKTRLQEYLQGSPAFPDFVTESNNHVHTIYSFSPYAPAGAALRAREAGLMVVGSVDHDSAAGAAEMAEAAPALAAGTAAKIRSLEMVSAAPTPAPSRPKASSNCPSRASAANHRSW